jgi:hypothetical protein
MRRDLPVMLGSILLTQARLHELIKLARYQQRAALARDRAICKMMEKSSPRRSSEGNPVP